MRSLIEIILGAANLLEAEGRAAKKNIIDVLVIGLVYLAAALLFLGGMLSLMVAFFLAMVDWGVHPAGALIFIAGMLFVVGAVCVGAVRMMHR